MYVRCTVFWCNKLQTEISFNMTDLEYIALNQWMLNTLYFMEILKEVSFIFDIIFRIQKYFFKELKDNQIFIDVDQSNKFSPAPKILQSIIANSEASYKISYSDLLYWHCITYYGRFTKPLEDSLFICLWINISGCQTLYFNMRESYNHNQTNLERQF